MPLVRIDITQDRADGSGRVIADAVHAAVVAAYGVPECDRFQIITAHPSGDIIAHDAGLGFTRAQPVVIQVFTQRGRTNEQKQRLYAEMAERLAEVGVSGEDVFIGYVENGPEDWSFAFGRAQYITGELGIPGRVHVSEPSFESQLGDRDAILVGGRVC